MNNETTADLYLDLTLQEVYALHKTVSIAIDNLNMKINRSGPDSRYGREAVADLRLLRNINRQILEILDKVDK